MKSKLTIEEVTQLKEQAEGIIEKVIERLEHETGLPIDDISFYEDDEGEYQGVNIKLIFP